MVLILKKSHSLMKKEDCLETVWMRPVGCVPPACCAYLPACTALGGSASGPGGGGSSGGSASGPGGGASQHALGQTPPPVNRMTDRQV